MSATWAVCCVDTASVDMLMHYICLCQCKPTYFHSKGQREIVAMSAFGKIGSPLVSVGSASLPPCGDKGNCIIYLNSGASGLLTFIQAGYEIETSVVDTVSILHVSKIV